MTLGWPKIIITVRVMAMAMRLGSHTHTHTHFIAFFSSTFTSNKRLITPQPHVVTSRDSK